MNKGFAHYFGQAIKCSAKTIWKGKGLFKSMIYLLMSFVGSLTVILSPVITLADVRRAKIAEAQQTTDIPQSFNNAFRKPLWTMVASLILEGLIFLGGFLLVSVPAGAIFGIGLAVSRFANADTAGLISLIFAVPGLIIYLVYIIIMFAMFAPTAYVVDTNPDLSAGEVVSVCFATMKSRGKVTAVLNALVPALVELAVLGICAGGFILFEALLFRSKYYLFVCVAWGLVSAALIFFIIPTFSLARAVAQNMLFGDIALDPVTSARRTEGINIKRISGARIDREEVADNLTALFGDDVEERKPSPDALKRKRSKKDKKSRKTGQPAEEVVQTEKAPLVEYDRLDEYKEYGGINVTKEEATAGAEPAEEAHAAVPQEAQDASNSEEVAETDGSNPSGSGEINS